MNYGRRIKNIEKAVEEIRMKDGGFRVVVKKVDETEEECLKRHGLDKDFPGLTVVIVKFRSRAPSTYASGLETENTGTD